MENQLKPFSFWRVLVIVYSIFGLAFILFWLFVPDSFPREMRYFILIVLFGGFIPVLLLYTYLFAYNVVYVDENKVVVEKDRLYITTTNSKTFIIYFKDIIKIEHSVAWWTSQSGGFEKDYILLKTTYGRYHLKILSGRDTLKGLLKVRFSKEKLLNMVHESSMAEKARCESFILKVNKEYKKFKRKELAK